MKEQDLIAFLKDFFLASQCEIAEQDPSLLRIQLTAEMDEALMNRPFYWRYKKRLGLEGEPMQLVLTTDPERKEEKSEWIHFGSPRLHQIFQLIREQAPVSRFYEAIHADAREPLYPWLVRNTAIHFSGKQKRTEIHSFGLQLVNGQILPSFMERLQPLKLKQQISDYCYTISPLIRYQSGMKRLSTHLHAYTSDLDQNWAKDALSYKKEELQLLDHFYHQITSEDEEEAEQRKKLYESEKSAIEQRLTPSVTLETINTALLYLTKETSEKIAGGL